MERDVPLGRIAGIRIGFSWSVLVVAALYTWLLATNRFPIDAPGHTSAAYWAAGVVASLLFFASLLAHEMGHSLVARHEGIEVEGITLWLLGGFARLESEPATPGAQLRIAIAGPVTNFTLAAVFVGVHQLLGGGPLLTPSDGNASLAAVICAWLAFINALLAVFNVIPAAPLDGGHVLSAGLWAATGDRAKAAGWSARAGMALGGLLVGLGLLQLGSSNAGNALWFVLVGWWILDAARRELASATVEQAFTDVTLGDIMQPDPPIVPDWITIDDLGRSLPPTTRHRAFPVQSRDGRITGLLTAERLVHTDAWHRAHTPVAQLAFPIDRVTWAAASDVALPALRRLAGTGLQTLLVVWPDGRVAGTVGQPELDAAYRRRRGSAIGAGRSA